MASKDQLRKVAQNCHEYTNNVDKSKIKFISCENCNHFTKEGKCDIDLVDKILSSLAMELDSK